MNIQTAKTADYNQCYTSGNSRRQAKRGQADKKVDSQHRGVDRQILRRDTSHGTQLSGVERPDEEVRHDAPIRLMSLDGSYCDTQL